MIAAAPGYQDSAPPAEEKGDMPVIVPRTKTPTVADFESTEVNDPPELTEPELAPVVRPSPVAHEPLAAPRSRRETLVSPIPALLAASMREIREDASDAARSAVVHPADERSPFVDGDPRHLLAEDDSDYVVELLDPVKRGG
jgi:hypothetical protein